MKREKREPKKTKEQLAAEWKANPPELPWTVDIAAAVWGISEPRVRVLFKQGRIPKSCQRGAKNIIIIEQTERPERAAPGELAPEQREVKDKLAGRQHQHRPR